MWHVFSSGRRVWVNPVGPMPVLGSQVRARRRVSGRKRVLRRVRSKASHVRWYAARQRHLFRLNPQRWIASMFRT